MTLGGWLLTSNALFFAFSALAVVASIAVFLLTRANDRQKDRDLAHYQASAHVDIENAKKDAADANRKAGEANERAAQLEKEAADANERAKKAEERIAELKLQIQKIVSPRSLSAEQTKQIISELSSIGGVQFDLAFTEGEQEVWNFTPIVENILKQAGWKQIDWTGNTLESTRPSLPKIGQLTASGIVFLYNSEMQDKLGLIAQDAASALSKADIVAAAEGEDWKPLSQGGTDLRKDIVHVIVGKKPVQE